MIELRNVTKFFGLKKAVDDISLTVNEGENMVLLGTSGCGKTTTLKLINRLLNPSEGSLFVNGENIAGANPEKLRRDMGYVLQNVGLFPHYTIKENVAVVPKLLGWSTDKIKKRTEVLLEKLHLPINYLTKFPKELSGGQQQRVGLARALAADPPILLMDEPFGALDNVTRSKIHTDFLGLDELKAKTIVMVTHDVHEAFTLADRICLMNDGKVVQVGTPKELLFNPVNEFARFFLDGERLALQFKVINLSDLMPHFPRKLNILVKGISKNSSVWEVMEKLSVTENSKLNILKVEASENINFDFDDLMQAFNKYQNINANE